MNIGDADGSYGDLSRKQRHALANLLNARKELMEKEAKLIRLQLIALGHPTSENEAAIRDYAATVTTPLREDYARQAVTLIRESVRVKELMEFLPAALSGVLQFVNLPLMLTAIGVERQEASRIIEWVMTYVKKGM